MIRIHTAIKVAFLLCNDKLVEELHKLVAAFRAKGIANLEIVKMGRTEMQDAVPMTVGPGAPWLRRCFRRRNLLLARCGEISLISKYGRHGNRHGYQCP